jgi:hypothetical protein
VHILLVPHVIYMHKLMLDHRRGLRVDHSPVPVLMIEGPKSLISPSLLGEGVAGLVAEGEEVHWVLLLVVYHLPVRVNDREPILEALKLVGSATTRRGILGGGLLLGRVRSCPLGKHLRVSGGGPAQARATSLLALLRMLLLSFISDRLQERIEKRSENNIGVLETRYKRPMKNP